MKRRRESRRDERLSSPDRAQAVPAIAVRPVRHSPTVQRPVRAPFVLVEAPRVVAEAPPGTVTCVSGRSVTLNDGRGIKLTLVDAGGDRSRGFELRRKAARPCRKRPGAAGGSAAFSQHLRSTDGIRAAEVTYRSQS